MRARLGRLRRRLSRRYALSERDRLIARLVEGRNAVLLSGYPKSGNTWTRFVVFNYFAGRREPTRTRTLTFDELNELQVHRLEEGLPLPDSQDGFPCFFRTHSPYYAGYRAFDHVVYIHRHPLDVLVSYYHMQRNRTTPFFHAPEDVRPGLHDIDFFVRWHLPSWIEYHSTTLPHASVALRYEDMRRDPRAEFLRMFAAVGWEIDGAALDRAVAMSSQGEVKRMEDETGQHFGNTDPVNFVGTSFVRSGREGEHRDVLLPETIAWAGKELTRSGVANDSRY